MITVPRVVLPSLKVTVPVTIPPYCGETVAVNVTACPAVDGFEDELRAVLVLALEITWLRAGEVLAAYVVSPLYTAEMDRVPTANVAVLYDAEPLLSATFAKVVVPDLNVTLPVGVPEPDAGVTVAVKVMDCP